MRELWIDAYQGLRLAGIVEKGQLTDLQAEPEARPTLGGSIVLGRVLRVDRVAGGAFVDIGAGIAGWLPLSRDPGDEDPVEGATLITQIVTEPRGGKGTRLTRDVALAGRTLVCRPYGAGIARSRALHGAVPDDISEALASRPGMGWIIRSAVREAPIAQVLAEAERLDRRWQALAKAAATASPPAVLAPGPDVAQRVILDAGEAAVIRVAPAPLHRALGRWIETEMPEFGGRLRWEDNDLVDRMLPLLSNRVTLPSGGWVSIEPTTALTAIDVNAGAGRDPLRANLEAATAIAAQLRLRNIGGTVVIDFISQRSPKARNQVMSALRTALASDPARVRTGRGFSDLGLVELARERRGLALHEAAAS